MADFALWIKACEEAVWTAGMFMAAYEANREDAVDIVLDSDAVAEALRRHMETRSIFEGTATELLTNWMGWPTNRSAVANSGPAVDKRFRGNSSGWRQHYAKRVSPSTSATQRTESRALAGASSASPRPARREGNDAPLQEWGARFVTAVTPVTPS